LILLFKINKINKSFTKLLISHKSLQHFVDNNNIEFKNEDDIHKENFIKFLSDSRDWAYQYIKDVQDGLEKFVNEVEPEIAYFDEYGLVGDAYPHYHSMKKISSEYKELKKLLPSEETKWKIFYYQH